MFIAIVSNAQLMNHYWGHNFNSTSSLLGGAVIAGDADNTAIFYNPATIGEMKDGNNISLSANLFSWNFYHFNNALGDGIDIKTDNFLVQPQFISYSYNPKKKKGMSISFSALTRVKERMEMTYSNSRYVDLLKYIPGEEKYSTTFAYRNDFSDTWVGFAISHDINEHFSYGISVFGSFATFNYRYSYWATAYNAGDTIGEYNVSRVSEGSYNEYIKFTDYRLLAKFGVKYTVNNWRIGLTITTPTWRLFSSGKRAQRDEQQSNISRNGMPAGFSDYIIFDGQQSSQIKTNIKLPFSAGTGFIYEMDDRGQKLYFSAEFFAGLKEYNMVDAEINPDITSEVVYDTLSNKNWTSFANASRPVINLAIGYSWTLKKDMVFLNAIKTDFSSVNQRSVNEIDNNYIKSTTYNIYHYSGGIKFNIKNNRIIAGGDLAFGFQKNQRQVANFSDPVEYEESSGRALQGPLENSMDAYYFGFNIYIGATLNFSKKEPNPKK